MNSSKGPVSKYSHILRHFELGTQNSADNKAKAGFLLLRRLLLLSFILSMILAVGFL